MALQKITGDIIADGAIPKDAIANDAIGLDQLDVNIGLGASEGQALFIDSSGGLVLDFPSSGGGGKKRQPELGEMTWFKVYQRQVVGMRKNSNNEIEVQLQPKIGNVDVFHLNPFRPWEKWSDCSLEQPNDEMIYIQKIKDIKIIKNIIHQSLYDMGLEPLRYTEQHYKDEIDFLDKLEKAQTEIIVPLHLPKINPAKIAIGDPKPRNKTQRIEKIKNIAINKKKLFSL